MLTWYTPDLLIQSLDADQYHIIMSCSSDAVAEHDLSKASNSNSLSETLAFRFLWTRYLIKRLSGQLFTFYNMFVFEKFAYYD